MNTKISRSRLPSRKTNANGLKRALKEALEGQSAPPSRPLSTVQLDSGAHVQFAEGYEEPMHLRPEASMSARSRRKSVTRDGNRRKSIIAQYTNLSDSESGDDEEFFDAIDDGTVEVVEPPLLSPPPVQASTTGQQEQDPFSDARAHKQMAIEPSYAGYEEGVRKRLKMGRRQSPEDFAVGHSQVYDWERHDEDDLARIFQRADFAASAGSRGYGVCRYARHCGRPA